MVVQLISAKLRADFLGERAKILGEASVSFSNPWIILSQLFSINLFPRSAKVTDSISR